MMYCNFCDLPHEQGTDHWERPCKAWLDYQRGPLISKESIQVTQGLGAGPGVHKPAGADGVKAPDPEVNASAEMSQPSAKPRVGLDRDFLLRQEQEARIKHQREQVASKDTQEGASSERNPSALRAEEAGQKEGCTMDTRSPGAPISTTQTDSCADTLAAERSVLASMVYLPSADVDRETLIRHIEWGNRIVRAHIAKYPRWNFSDVAPAVDAAGWEVISRWRSNGWGRDLSSEALADLEKRIDSALSRTRPDKKPDNPTALEYVLEELKAGRLGHTKDIAEFKRRILEGLGQ